MITFVQRFSPVLMIKIPSREGYYVFWSAIEDQHLIAGEALLKVLPNDKGYLFVQEYIVYPEHEIHNISKQISKIDGDKLKSEWDEYVARFK